MSSNLVIGIDATRNRSGGAITYITSILNSFNPSLHDIDCIHIWGTSSLLSKIDDYPCFVKHPVNFDSFILEALWQFCILPFRLKLLNVNYVLNPDAGTLNFFTPAVTLSQDLLSFEPGERFRYPFFSFMRARLFLLKHLQYFNLNRSVCPIFLTNHALNTIFTNSKPSNFKIIPHGISSSFSFSSRSYKFYENDPEFIEILYVSNIDLYKHNCNVIEAIFYLRSTYNLNIRLKLVGAVSKYASDRFNAHLQLYDSNSNYVKHLGFVPNTDIPNLLRTSDIFVFASSCENLPITLLEGMFSSLPIACSNRGPMPEVLSNSGIYFDPEDVSSISSSLYALISSTNLRASCGRRAHVLASDYSWSRTAYDTWNIFTSL